VKQKHTGKKQFLTVKTAFISTTEWAKNLHSFTDYNLASFQHIVKQFHQNVQETTDTDVAFYKLLNIHCITSTKRLSFLIAQDVVRLKHVKFLT